MKKRLISLLLAFSMMLTFLPAGAVSAFAEEPIAPSKEKLLQGGETITGSGTYQLSGPYTEGITIDTEDSVEINVTGNVTGNLLHTEGSGIFSVTTAVPLITIKRGTVTFNGDNSYTVASNALIRNDGGNLTVQGGTYVSTSQRGLHYADCFSLDHGRNLIKNVTIETIYEAIGFYGDGEYAEINDSKIVKTQGFDGNEGINCKVKSNGIMNLNNVEVMAESNAALQAVSGTITINGGKYSSKQSAAILAGESSDQNLDLNINGGTYQSYDYGHAVASFGCYSNSSGRKCNIKINGSKFIGGQLLGFYGECAETLTIEGNTTLQSTGGAADAVVVGHGQLIFNSGTIEVSGGSERAALRTYDMGEAIVDGGTFKGAKYDIYERSGSTGPSPCRVQLKKATFDDKVCNVYLASNRLIDVDPAYTGLVSIECFDPSDHRQLTKATEPKGQENLNLTSANEGYVVGYRKIPGSGECRCLSKKVGVTVSGLERALKAEDPAEFTVTLTHVGSIVIGGVLTFGDKNGEIEYKDENGAYWPLQEYGWNIDLGVVNQYTFRITPQTAGEQKLTATVVRDAVELGTAEENFTVAGRVPTAVTIEGLENAVIKEGESKDFTVTVTPNDDAKLGEAFIDFGNKNGEIEYKDENGVYHLMPEGGLPIRLGDGEKPYAFRITPKTPGQKTLTAVVKQGEKELASDTTNLTGTKTLSVTGGTATVEKDGRTLNIVPVVTGDKKTYSIPEDNVKVTVTLDKTQIPEGMVFDMWTTGSFLLPSGQNYKAETITFTMKKESVDIAAQYRDATIEDDGSTVLGTAAVIGTAVVGTMVLGYQAYSLGTEFAGYLMDLPYFPANRSALAVMLWEDAGKPMPESERLYPDVGQEEQDMDLQHAARWAMENDLIPDRNEEGTAPEEMKFYPDNAVSRIDVLKAWQKAQELKKNA